MTSGMVDEVIEAGYPYPSDIYVFSGIEIYLTIVSFYCT